MKKQSDVRKLNSGQKRQLPRVCGFVACSRILILAVVGYNIIEIKVFLFLSLLGTSYVFPFSQIFVPKRLKSASKQCFCQLTKADVVVSGVENLKQLWLNFTLVKNNVAHSYMTLQYNFTGFYNTQLLVEVYMGISDEIDVSVKKNEKWKRAEKMTSAEWLTIY